MTTGRTKVLDRVGRYWRTLRHLRGEQLRYLVVRRLLRYPRRVAQPERPAPRSQVKLPALMPLARTAYDPERGFSFVGVTRPATQPIDWAAPGMSRLWRYNLHYFDWFRQPGIDTAGCLRQARDWIAHNPPFRGTGWEPYPTALRIVNWLGRLPPDQRAGDIDASLALQAAWLQANLEFQLGANHLFVDLKALAFAGVAYGGESGDRWLATAERLLRREFDEQFLADGGHYERSPMYHALLTMDLLELLALGEANPSVLSQSLTTGLREVVPRALGFAREVHFPDDGPALFNDSTLDIAPPLPYLNDYAAELGYEPGPANASSGALLNASGFWCVRRGSTQLIADCGEIGPVHQPGHGHCDLLSFELAVDGQRVIGNCGNYDYEAGARREFARSTRAHNTLSVDGEEQSEVWSVFRVGRRARPLEVAAGRRAGECWLDARHDGFRYLAGAPVHRRSITVDDQFAIDIRDEVSGEGEHAVAAWLHLAPGIRVEYDDGAFVATRAGKACLRIECDAGAAAIETVPRYPRFGEEASGASIVFSGAGPLPLILRYRIVILR